MCSLDRTAWEFVSLFEDVWASAEHLAKEAETSGTDEKTVYLYRWKKDHSLHLNNDKVPRSVRAVQRVKQTDAPRDHFAAVFEQASIFRGVLGHRCSVGSVVWQLPDNGGWEEVFDVSRNPDDPKFAVIPDPIRMPWLAQRVEDCRWMRDQIIYIQWKAGWLKNPVNVQFEAVAPPRPPARPPAVEGFSR